MDRKSAALVAAFGTAIVPFTQSLEPATAIVFSREGVRIAEMPIPFNAQPTGLDVASGEILIPYSISARWESWWFDNRPASAPESNRPFLMTTFSRDRFYFSAIPKHYRREPWDKRDQFDNGVNKIILKSPFSGEKIEITNSCF
jgi:hypothetical protein